jgi:hypothetical protein
MQRDKSELLKITADIQRYQFIPLAVLAKLRTLITRAETQRRELGSCVRVRQFDSRTRAQLTQDIAPHGIVLQGVQASVEILSRDLPLAMAPALDIRGKSDEIEVPLKFSRLVKLRISSNVVNHRNTPDTLLFSSVKGIILPLYNIAEQHPQ